MYICFIDEAGCPGELKSATAKVQPVLVIAGLFMKQQDIKSLTLDFLQIKRKYFPLKFSASKHDLDDLKIEIKGADDLRKSIRNKGNKAKTELRFIEDVLKLLNHYDVKLFSRIWIKGIGTPFKGKAIYALSIWHMLLSFNHFLKQKNETGIAVADFRTPSLNSSVSHTILTRKFKVTGDELPNILEVPVFGHSENHALLQITDVICSAILSPIAMHTYCKGAVKNGLVHYRDGFFKVRFSKKLKGLQHHYTHKNKKKLGISVRDAIGGKTSWSMFN